MDDEYDDDEYEDEPEPEPAPPKKLTARAVARMAAEQVMEMTGKESESVTSVHKSADGWTVGLEVVESRRIPDSTDLLASYEVEMDADGDLISYRRTRRYNRGRGDDE
ncbi:gas vesicle protein [Actinomycetospora sp. TBRC 11914]|nr:gas vesicle protein [Actinomycetospora sp. TBRC 11914]